MGGGAGAERGPGLKMADFLHQSPFGQNTFLLPSSHRSRCSSFGTFKARNACLDFRRKHDYMTEHNNPFVFFFNARFPLLK